MKISEKLSLQEVTLAEDSRLFGLMQEIYPPVYGHLWQDGGASYLINTYGRDNLAKELNQPNALYGFVKYDTQIVGILRTLHNEPLANVQGPSATKLHRIYLNSQGQGRGIGRQLMQWVEESSRTSGSVILWLEVMDTQEKAIGFYQKMGFEICGSFTLEAPLVNEAYQGMYRMCKTL
jgi:diamine N-acetyltransferase